MMRANLFLPVLPVTAITRFQKQPLLQTSLKGLNHRPARVMQPVPGRIHFHPTIRRSPMGIGQQAEQQQVAKLGLAEFQTRLRALDGDGQP